jgi:hypothetical protein
MNMCTQVITTSFIFLASAVAIAEDTTLSDANVPYLYESRAKIPAPDYKLAGYISVEYHNAQDEFTKRDLFIKIKPVLQERLTQARTTTDVILHVNTNIGEYNFEKHAFPTGFSDSTYIPFSNGYAAIFVNTKDTEFVAVPETRARDFASILRQGRQGTMVIKAKIVGTEERQVDYLHNKVLKLWATEFKLLHHNGHEFGSKTL